MLHFYHPNKSITGFAASFWQSHRDNTVFATILKQSGWDEKNDNGVFKGSMNDPQKRVNIKLDNVEIAGILDCIERGRGFKNFHENDETPKTISFTPWMSQDGATQKGFSFSILVTNKQDTSYKNSFYIGLTFAEARLIREFLVFCLHKTFSEPKNSFTQNQEAKPTPEEVEPVENTPVETPTETQNKVIVEDPLVGF